MQDEVSQVSFRKQAVDNVFSSGKKTILVLSPPSLGITVIFVIGFVLFLIGLICVTKIPVYVQAQGEILAGKQYHQIVVNQDDKNVAKLNVSVGQYVSIGQELAVLEHRDKSSVDNQIKDIDVQMSDIEKRLYQTRKNLSLNLTNLSKRRNEQLSIVSQYKESLQIEERLLRRYIDGATEGLIQQQYLDNQYRAVSDIKSSIVKENAQFTLIDMSVSEITQQHWENEQSLMSQLERLTINLSELKQGTKIISPCECTVDNVLVSKEQPIAAGQSILTLSQDNEESSLQLFIPTQSYKPIHPGMKLKVNVTAYPSAKYGALNALVSNASRTPVPGELINSSLTHGQAYFIIQAKIHNVPKGVVLATGMSIESDVAVDAITLFDMLVNKG